MHITRQPFSSCLRLVDQANACEETKDTYLWKTWGTGKAFSALDAVSHYEPRIRQEFLTWVYDFSETVIEGKTVREHLTFSDGASAWWMSRIFERHPVIYSGSLFEVFKLRALELFLSEHPYTAIEADTDDVRLHHTLQRFCQQSGIDYKNAKPIPPVTGQPHFFNYLKRSLSYLRKWWRDRRAKFAVSPKITRGRGLAIAAWFPNIDLEAAKKDIFISKYWEGLQPVFTGMTLPIHWYLVHVGETEQIAEHTDLRDRFLNNLPAGSSITFWEECIGLRQIFHICLEWIQSAKAAIPLDAAIDKLCRWPGSNLHITAYIRPLWESSTRGPGLVRELLFRHAAKQWARMIGPQRLGLTPSEFQSWERSLLRSLRQTGAFALYGTMHSMVGPGELRYFVNPQTWDLPEFREQMPDFFLCNGEGAYTFMQLEKGSFPKERLKKAEAIRYLHLQETQVAQQKQSTANKLMVLLGYYDNEIHSQLKILSHLIRDGVLPISQVILKPHPARPIASFLPRYFPSGIYPEETHKPTAEVLTPDLVVYACNSTSSAVEAAYKGLPLLIQLIENDFNYCPLSLVPEVVFVRTAEDLMHGLKTAKPVALPKNFFFLETNLPKWRALFEQHDLL